MKLEWEKFEGFRDLLLRNEGWKDLNNHHRAGVYLHTAPLPPGGDEIACYVGRTLGRPTIFRRQIDHYQNLIGGRYFIPKEFLNAEKDDWYPGLKPNENGPGFEEKTPFESKYYNDIFNKELFQRLISSFFDHAKNTAVYIATLDREADITYTEKELISLLKPLRNYKKDRDAKPKKEHLLSHRGDLSDNQFNNIIKMTNNFAGKKV